jgi:hypothetical protein
LRISASGPTKTVVRSFDVPGGVQSPSFVFSGLPLGSVAFLAEAFELPCAGMAPQTIPDWISDQVTAVIEKGVRAAVPLTLRANTSGTLQVDFEDDGGEITIGSTGAGGVGGKTGAGGQGGGVAGQGGGGVIDNRDEINRYFRSLPTWSSQHPLGPPSDVTTGSAESSSTTIGGRAYVCTTTPRSLGRSPEKIVTFSPDAGKMWLGSLLQGSGYSEGPGSLKELPVRERAPLRLFIDLLGEGVTKTVEDPDGASVQQAIGSLISDAKTAGTPFGSSVFFQQAETSSAPEGLAKLGFSTKYAGAEVKGSLENNPSASERTVIATFIQKAFTVAMVTPTTPADFFAPAFSKAKLDEQVALGRIGPENLPVYVSNIAFGRLVVVTITSSASTEEIKGTLNAVYNGDHLDASLDWGSDYKNVLATSSIKVVSVGGDDEKVLALIRSGTLRDYFTAPVDLATMRPISFQVDNMADNSAAKFMETTSYSLKECRGVEKRKVGETVVLHLLRGYVPKDCGEWPHVDHNANPYGEIYVDSALAWSHPEGDSLKIAQFGTFPFGFSSEPRTFRDGQGGEFSIKGFIAEYNRVGNHPKNLYDLRVGPPFAFNQEMTFVGNSRNCPYDLIVKVEHKADIFE